VSFHCSVKHFHVEKRHYQDALQQHQVQHPKQCTPGDLPSNPGWHCLIMGLKIDSSFVYAQLFKMKVTIENIASLVAVGNLAVN
jgi:hypothetical protein